MVTLPLGILLLSITVLDLTVAKSACKLQFAGSEEPLVTDKGGEILPKFDFIKGNRRVEIPIESNSEFTVTCVGLNDQLAYFGTRAITAQCNDDGTIVTEYGDAKVDQFVCSASPLVAATTSRNGNCYYDRYTNAEISFPGMSPLIQVCHDEAKCETLWAKSYIEGARLSQSESINRPNFAEGIFYPDIDAQKCYTQVEQKATIAEIIGTQMADHYIQPTKELYFSRGHLCPNGDCISGDEKRASFYFINACPQWQSINNGNWVRLENNLRDYAQTKGVTLVIWTGTWGVTTLKDENGNDKEIYLGKDSNGVRQNVLPAPRCMYKVIYDESVKAGIAVIQINNPYPENHKKEDIICPDICKQTSLVNWNVTNAQEGYTYCCTVESFNTAMPGRLPDLGDLAVLS